MLAETWETYLSFPPLLRGTAARKSPDAGFETDGQEATGFSRFDPSTSTEFRRPGNHAEDVPLGLGSMSSP